MRMSEEIGEIAAALAKAQAEFKHPTKNKTMTQRGTSKSGKAYEITYPYADLPNVLDAVVPALNKNGIAVVQGTSGPSLTTMLVHESGQWMAADYDLPTNCTSQQLGAAITYGRRYSIAAMAGVAAEDDDDASTNEQAGVTTEPPDPAPGPMDRDTALITVTRQIVEDEKNKALVKEWIPGVTRKKDALQRVSDLVRDIASQDNFTFVDEVTDDETAELYKATLAAISQKVDERTLEQNGEAA